MAKSDSLFTLIKTLSKAEKRNLKVSAAQTGGREPSYIKLFDLMVKEDEYDKTLLIKKMGKGWNDKSFSDLKKYLFDTLLEDVH